MTGAATGLGREVARQLVTAGHRVVITSRDPERAAGAAAEVGAAALPFGLDIGDPASVRAAADSLNTSPGRLDALVNNAAAYVDWNETAASADLDVSRTVMETNLYGAWRMTQAMLPLLRASGRGRVVNVSSGAGSHGDQTFGLSALGGAAASYGISKAALNALTATLATQLRADGILVNAVCPGLTATYPGAEAMGARPADESAEGVVWAVTLPPDGPSGGLYRDRIALPW